MNTIVNNNSSYSTSNQRLVDLYCDLVTEISDKIEMLDDLKKQIAKLANDSPDEGPVTLVGEKWKVEYSARVKNNELNVSPQWFLSATDAWGAVSISAPKAKQILTEAQFNLYFEPVLGARRMKKILPLHAVQTPVAQVLASTRNTAPQVA